MNGIRITNLFMNHKLYFRPCITVLYTVTIHNIFIVCVLLLMHGDIINTLMGCIECSMIRVVVFLAYYVHCLLQSHTCSIMFKHMTTKVKCRSSGNSALWLAVMEEKIVHESAVKFATTKSNGKLVCKK